MTKKDKRYNTPLDNYTNKYKGAFKLGLVYVITFLICLWVSIFNLINDSFD